MREFSGHFERQLQDDIQSPEPEELSRQLLLNHEENTSSSRVEGSNESTNAHGPEKLAREREPEASRVLQSAQYGAQYWIESIRSSVNRSTYMEDNKKKYVQDVINKIKEKTHHVDNIEKDYIDTGDALIKHTIAELKETFKVERNERIKNNIFRRIFGDKEYKIKKEALEHVKYRLENHIDRFQDTSSIVMKDRRLAWIESELTRLNKKLEEIPTEKKNRIGRLNRDIKTVEKWHRDLKKEISKDLALRSRIGSEDPPPAYDKVPPRYEDLNK